ncbi:MAG: hypothetical protein GYB65_03885 [Chloroflexi bacterium]|nr:hypothetical protein [Chloroflexota bacterium]
MKRLLLHNPLSRRLSRSQRGQSILLMAFAFIALVAFVGLVTDIALLFVRYAALRRAVDSAAIAAAGQIREGTDYGEVTVAAQQYIELHNLETDSILVETCETDIYQWRTGLGPWQGVPHSEAAYPPPVSQHMPETELCDWDDPHKLVRVSAQVDSPTTFLSLIGIDTITLEATSVSETAVIDIALVLDTSESMSNETSIVDYVNVGLGPNPDGGPTNVRPGCVSETGDNSLERWGGCCNDPGTGNVGDGERQSNGIVVPNGLVWHDTNGNSMWDGAFENGLRNNSPQSTNPYDPDARNFTTLICQPFKDVKDAARMFIKRLDFVRGDRVVLVTFDRQGIPYDPDGDAGPMRPLMRSEATAIHTLNTRIGVQINGLGVWNRCAANLDALAEWDAWINGGMVDPEPEVRPLAYESVAACGNTNVGGGILAANNSLTDPLDIRREAVWVMIVLSDGAANVTNAADDVGPTDYGYHGYCPWWTFCDLGPGTPYVAPGESPQFVWPECTNNNPAQTETQPPVCNDNNPDTRFFCLDWGTGLPDDSNPECGSAGHYDADDYARDMADFAGLIEVAPDGSPGNFIAMFAIAFGNDVVNEPTGAPLLRYIADAGDNGFIDNNLQQDWRDNQQLDYLSGTYPPSFGDPGPCEGESNPRAQCGQYYFASDLDTLNEVFEEIAGRLFTRLSR